MKKILISITIIVIISLTIVMIFNGNIKDKNNSENQTNLFIITSPYENVDWEYIGYYKAALHVHTDNSTLMLGGKDDTNKQTPEEVIEDHYSKGYDILAITDHNVLTPSWSSIQGGLSSFREKDINSGVGRNKRGMYQIPYGIEQSMIEHVNTYFVDYVNYQYARDNYYNKIKPYETFENKISLIDEIQKLKGLSVINHIGRYSGGNKNLTDGKIASNNPDLIKKYTDLFMDYSSVVGMEIIHRLDLDTFSDRILWDNILMNTIPKGRFIWGFASDDRHYSYHIGWAFNMMLIDPNKLESNSTDAIRKAMENGTFYAVSFVDKREGINGHIKENEEEKYYDLTNNEPPSITKIITKDDKITIEGSNYDLIEWIADGKKIATGNTIDLKEYSTKINSYVRAQLIKKDVGIAFTQPFKIERKD